jgi:hypothetical protein
MATNHHGHGSDDAGNASVTYDRSDLGARGILIFFLVLAVFAVCIHLAVLGMWVGLSKVADKHDPELSPLAPHTVTPRVGVLMNTANVNVQQFPEPRLQSDDTGDMTRFLQKETDALTAEPWQDAQGNVHLPIEQAMQVTAGRLAVRTGGTAPVNYPGAGSEVSHPAAQLEESAKPENATPSEAEAPATK